MDAKTKSQPPARRRAMLALSAVLSFSLLGAGTQTASACVPGAPPEVCNLLPTLVNVPSNNLSVMGRTFLPANPQVSLRGFLYLHNYDTSQHWIMFSNGVEKKIEVTRAGPLSDKILINAPKFAQGQTYSFACLNFPEMTGSLTVLPPSPIPLP